MSQKIHSRFVPIKPYILEAITESDIDPKILDLTDIVPLGTVCVYVRAERTAGTGNFSAHPYNADDTSINVGNQTQKGMGVVPIKYPDFMYHLSVINDVWNLWLYGYMVNNRVR